MVGLREVIVGDSGDLSILAYAESAINAEDPVFELLDRVRNVTYWVRVIPTPRVARELLGERGEPPGEQRGSPRRRRN
ncbi:MAG: hypothetical protein M3Q60_16125 [Actinomycetota bacterium]|nr:hypothetical protein [Actinomycetota bacterium]